MSAKSRFRPAKLPLGTSEFELEGAAAAVDMSELIALGINTSLPPKSSPIPLCRCCVSEALPAPFLSPAASACAGVPRTQITAKHRPCLKQAGAGRQRRRV
jgi:hypothetical protein